MYNFDKEDFRKWLEQPDTQLILKELYYTISKSIDEKYGITVPEYESPFIDKP